MTSEDNPNLDFDPIVKQLLDGSISMRVAEEPTAQAYDPQEKELADLLVSLTQKYGKFDEDGKGVWAGYEPAKANDVKDIGVKCANCALYEGGSSCKIIVMEVEPDAKCRFAIIHDGIVKK